jgi:hypothetical protein
MAAEPSDRGDEAAELEKTISTWFRTVEQTGRLERSREEESRSMWTYASPSSSESSFLLLLGAAADERDFGI